MARAGATLSSRAKRPGRLAAISTATVAPVCTDRPRGYSRESSCRATVHSTAMITRPRRPSTVQSGRYAPALRRRRRAARPSVSAPDMAIGAPVRSPKAADGSDTPRSRRSNITDASNDPLNSSKARVWVP